MGPFALAIFTAGTRAWHAFNGTITSPEVSGLEDLDILIDSVTVILYDTAGDSSWLNHSANPLVVGTKTFNSPSTLLSVSVPAEVTVSDFLYASGTFTFALGGTMNVDVATGITGTPPVTLQPALNALTVLASDNGTLGRSADYSIIYNLPVRSFQIAATNVNIFLGNEFAWVDGSNGGTDDGLIQEVELGADTVGFYVGGVDIGVLLLSGQPTGKALFDAAIHPKFFALSGSAAELGLVHIPVFDLDARSVTVDVNQGKAWAPAAPGTPVPVIDWQLSFPDTAIDTDTDPDGFQLLTPGDPVVFALRGTPVVGVSVEHLIMTIGDNVHISGAFSFRIGETESVDVNTGLVSPTLPPAGFTGVTVSGTDPGTGLARTSDYSMIWNLPVNTIKIGAEGVSIFLGDGLAEYDLDDDIANGNGTLDLDELGDDAQGFFVEDVDLGMVFASVVPFVGAQSPLNLLKFLGLKLTADSAGLVGFEDILTLTSRGIVIEINQGTKMALTAPSATIDWALSFPGGTPGLPVPTGDPANPVVLDFRGTPLVGVAAEHVILAIGDNVHISGAVSFRFGEIETVDVNTGLQDPTLPPASLSGLPVAADGSGSTLGRSDDYSMLWNLRVSTIKVGAEGVSIFLGDGLADYDLDDDIANDNGTLDLDELGDDAQGFFIEDIDLGLVLASAVPLTGPRAPLSLLKFVGLKATADSAGLVGFEDVLTLTSRGIVIEVNQGTPLPGGPLGSPAATIDWGLSFPGTTPGLAVQTGDPANPVVLDYRGTPLVGVAAEHVVLDDRRQRPRLGGDQLQVRRGRDRRREHGSAEPDGAADVAGGVAGGGGRFGVDVGPLGRLLDDLEPARVDDQGRRGGRQHLPRRQPRTARHDTDNNGTLDLDELGADAKGFFIEDVDLGLVLASTVPFTGAQTPLNLLKFIGLKATADSAGLVGFEDVLTLTSRMITVEVNGGTVLVPWRRRQ